MKKILLSSSIFGLMYSQYNNLVCLSTRTLTNETIVLIPVGETVFHLHCGNTPIQKHIQMTLGNSIELPKVYKVKNVNTAFPTVQVYRQYLPNVRCAIVFNLKDCISGLVDSQSMICPNNDFYNTWEIINPTKIIKVSLDNKKDMTELVKVLYSKGSPYNVDINTHFFK